MKNKTSIKSVAKYIVEGPNSITKLILKKKKKRIVGCNVKTETNSYYFNKWIFVLHSSL
jgi:hypothetical protein